MTLTPTDRVLTKTFRVGERYKCTLTIPLDVTRGVHMATAEWEPCNPEQLTDQEVDHYRRELDALLVEVAEARGDAN